MKVTLAQIDAHISGLPEGERQAYIRENWDAIQELYAIEKTEDGAETPVKKRGAK